MRVLTRDVLFTADTNFGLGLLGLATGMIAARLLWSGGPGRVGRDQMLSAMAFTFDSRARKCRWISRM